MRLQHHSGGVVDVHFSGVAIGDPYVGTTARGSLDLCRTEWSTFVQVPLSSVEPFKLFVRGDVRPYGSAPYAPAFLLQVWINGIWLGIHGISVHSGSLESSDPFCVVRRRWRTHVLQRGGVTEFVSENGVSVSGRIAIDEGWGPDAKVELTVGGVVVSIAKHTEVCGKFGTPCSFSLFLAWQVVVRLVGVAGSEGAG